MAYGREVGVFRLMVVISVGESNAGPGVVEPFLGTVTMPVANGESLGSTLRAALFFPPLPRLREEALCPAFHWQIISGGQPFSCAVHGFLLSGICSIP